MMTLLLRCHWLRRIATKLVTSSNANSIPNQVSVVKHVAHESRSVVKNRFIFAGILSFLGLVHEEDEEDDGLDPDTRSLVNNIKLGIWAAQVKKTYFIHCSK